MATKRQAKADRIENHLITSRSGHDKPSPAFAPLISHEEIELIEQEFPAFAGLLGSCSRILELELPLEATRQGIAGDLLLGVFEQARQSRAETPSEALRRALSEKAEAIALKHSGRATFSGPTESNSPVPLEGWNQPRLQPSDPVKLFHVYWVAALIVARSITTELERRRARPRSPFPKSLVCDLLDCQHLIHDGNFIDGRMSMREHATREAKLASSMPGATKRHKENQIAKKLAVDWFRKQPLTLSGNHAANRLHSDEALRLEVTKTKHCLALATYRKWFQGVSRPRSARNKS